MMINSQISPEVLRDIEYGQLAMLITTPDDDVKGNIDIIISNLRVAWRKRRVNLSKWYQVSIRDSRKSGTRTEKDKILAGECKSLLYIFEFLDCWVLCRLSDILERLKEKQYEIVPVLFAFGGKYFYPLIRLSDRGYLLCTSNTAKRQKGGCK